MSNHHQASKPTPKDWPRLSAAIFYDDPHAAIDWLCDAFGFELRLKVEGEGGSVEHSELTFGEALVMVGGTQRGGHQDELPCRSPRSLNGAITQAVALFIDDADAHAAHAKAKGAKIISAPSTTDYGEDYWTDRTYQAEDLEGHRWWFMERVRSRGSD